MNKSYRDGFHLINCVGEGGARSYPVGAGVEIAKGDALVITSGYVALGTADLGLTFAGIAADENTAAEAVANGTINTGIIPPLPNYQFIVPVEATDLITLAQVGAAYDIETEDGIDENDTSFTAWGFYVDEIDVSAEAIVASTFGFAIGHWTLQT